MFSARAAQPAINAGRRENAACMWYVWQPVVCGVCRCMEARVRVANGTKAGVHSTRRHE